MPTAEHIAHLLYLELEGTLSEAEAMELQNWKSENPEQLTFSLDLLDEDRFAEITRLHHPENKEAVRRRILAKIEDQLSFKVVPLYRRGFFRVAVAACIAALIIAGGYFMFFNKEDESKPPIAKTNDVEPPKVDKAVIRLADGRIISVDSLTTYQQGNVKVTRMEDGRLVYSGLGTEVVFNTLTNPRGSKVIDMTLSDGSRVWLNSGSSISYPVSFTGSERKVTMTGEAYLEVTHNASMPFIVSKGEMNVQVIGTQFNVNAYDDEPNIKVTLLEGSVNVNGTIISPGQQAQVSNDVEVLSNIDVDAVMAWKNGKFVFGDKADIGTIMRQIARWYDVDVEYKGTFTNHFGGSISREVNVSLVLKVLETTGNIKFTVEGRKVTVMPL